MKKNTISRICSLVVIFSFLAPMLPEKYGQAAPTKIDAGAFDDISVTYPSNFPGYTSTYPIHSKASCYVNDLDCDRDVDEGDVRIAADRWNCAVGDGCYVVSLDLDNNQVIDVIDLASIANDYDVTPPEITLLTPEEGQVLAPGSIQVRGMVTDAHLVTGITVNGASATLIGSEFQAVVSLESGNQVVDLLAVDELGQTSVTSRLVVVDGDGPVIEINSPKHRQSVYTLTPFVEIEYGDFSSGVNTGSLSVMLIPEGGAGVNITGSLVVTGGKASGIVNAPLLEDTRYTLAVSITDSLGNESDMEAYFYVPENPSEVTPPEEPSGAGWVSGVVYDTFSCSEHLTGCKGLPGVSVTLAEAEGPGLSGTVISGPDGFFAFPTPETGHYWLRAEKEGYTYGQREVAIVREHSTATNNIYLTQLDPAVSFCDSSGCTHTSSDGVLRVEIPPGAIGAGQVVTTTATNFEHVEFLPSGELPPGTAETYAFNLGGASEVTFTQPITVSMVNSLGFPPGFRIPLGYWNQNTLDWEHAGFGVVDTSGQWVVMQVTHFSNYDCNAPWAGPGGVGRSEANGEAENQSNRGNNNENNSGERDRDECENGEGACFVELSTGFLEEDYSLPPVKILSKEVAPAFVYNTSRAAPSAVIDFSLSVNPQAGAELGSYVTFELSIEGKLIDGFTFSADFLPGEVARFRYLWDGRDAMGNLMPPGIYPYVVLLGIPFRAQWCGTDYFGGPPNCIDYPSGIYQEMIDEIWAMGSVKLNSQYDSSYGTGWILDGQQRLYQDQAGRIMVVDGDRMDEFYFPWKNQLVAPISQTVSSLVAWTNGGDYYDTTRDSVQFVPEDNIKESSGTFIRTSQLPYEMQLSPDGKLAYFTNYYNDFGNTGISVIDLVEGVEVGVIDIGYAPMAIALSGDGVYAYTTFPSCWIEPSKLSIVNLVSEEVINISLGLCAYYVAISPDGNTAYVTDRYENSVYVVDLVTQSITNMIPVDYRPEEIALSPDGAYAYIVARNSLSIVDLVAQVKVLTIPLSDPGDIAISPDGSFAYILSYYYGSLMFVDLKNNVLVNSLNLGMSYPGAIAITSDGKFAYISSERGDRFVSVVDLDQQLVVGKLLGGGGEHPEDIAVSEDGRLLYLADSYMGHITVLDLDLVSQIEAIEAGDYPVSLAFSPDGNWIYAVNYMSDSVSVIDVHTQQEVTQILVGDSPSSIAVSADGSTAYVANQTSHTISILDLTSNTVADTFGLDYYSPANIELSADQTKALVLTGSYILVVDLVEKFIKDKITLSGNGRDMALTPDKNYAYVSRNDNSISYVNLTDKVEVLVIPDIPSPLGVAVNPTGEYLYIACANDMGVKRIDVFTGDVVNIPILHYPEQITISPDGSYAYVTHYRNSISVIDTAQAKVVEVISTGMYPTDVAVSGRVAGSLNAISRTDTDNTRLVYDPFTGTFMREYPDGSKVHFNSDGSHDYTQEPDGTITKYSYNSDDTTATIAFTLTGQSMPRWTWAFQYAGLPPKLTSITDPAGRVTNFDVDGHGFLTKIIGPDGESRKYSYRQDGLLTQFTDESSQVTTYTYDAYGRIRTVEEPPRPLFNPQSGQVEFQRDSLTFTNSDTGYPLINEIINADPDNPVPALPGSRVLLDQIRSGTTIRSGHTNSYGSWTDMTNRLGYTTTYSRDSKNHPTRVDYPDGTCTISTFDARGNHLSETHLTQALCSSMISALSESDLLAVPNWTYSYEDRYNKLKTKTDPLGNTITYVYDYEEGLGDAGNLIRILYPPVRNELDQLVTPIESFTYNLWGQKLTEVDKRGTITAYVYTQGIYSEAYGQPGALFAPGVTPVPGLLTKVVHDYGGLAETTVYKNFDAAGNPMTILGPGGTTAGGACCSGASTAGGSATYLTYDSHNRVVTETNALGIVTQYSYDERGNLAQKIADYTADPAAGRNITSRYLYSSKNLLIQEHTAADGMVIQNDYGYDINRMLVLEQDGLGNRTLRSYDEAKQLVSLTDPAGNITSYTYSPVGRLLSKTGPEGSLTRYTYDDFGRLITTTVDEGGLNLATSYSYDLSGNVLTTTDPAGAVICYQYNSHNRRVQKTQDCGGLNLTTNYRYDLNGNLTYSSSPDGSITVTQYDRLDRENLVRRDDGGLNLKTEYMYDLSGNLEQVIDERGAVTRFSYDAMQQPTQECRDALGLNLCVSYTYDRIGNLLATTSPDGVTTRTEYSAFGVLLRYIDDYEGLNAVTTYQYDQALNLVWVADSNGNPLVLEYNQRGQVVVEKYADGKQISTTYNGLGNVNTITRQDGSIINHTYDGAGRLVSRVFSGGGSQTFSYDGAGRMLSAGQTMNGHTSLLSYTYNAVGEVTWNEQLLDGVAWQVSYQQDYTGNRAVVTYPSGLQRVYKKNKVGRLESVKDGGGSSIASYAYHISEGYITVAFANGITQRIDYDRMRRTTRVSSEVADYRYGYSAQASPLFVQRWHEEGRPVDVYEYNRLGQVSQVWYGANATTIAASTTYENRQVFNLDLNGNRLEVQNQGVQESYLPSDGVKLTDPMNRYKQVGTDTFSYDVAGNIVSDGKTSYAYDLLNRQIQAANTGGSTEYIYDALGKRLAKVVGGISTRYVYDTSYRVIEERSENGNLLAAYTYGAGIDEVLQMERSGTTYTYLRDGLGSVTEVTNSAGEKIETYKYDVFGQVRIYSANGSLLPGSLIGNPYLFTGGRYDNETGNYSFRARVYSPRTGRFLQMDPLKEELNLYTYARNNPVNRIDPLGLYSFPAAWNVGGEGEACFPLSPCPVCYICITGSIEYTGSRCCDESGNRRFYHRIQFHVTISLQIRLMYARPNWTIRGMVHGGFIGDCPTRLGLNGEAEVVLSVGMSIPIGRNTPDGWSGFTLERGDTWQVGLGCSVTYNFMSGNLDASCSVGLGTYMTGMAGGGTFGYSWLSGP